MFKTMKSSAEECKDAFCVNSPLSSKNSKRLKKRAENGHKTKLWNYIGARNIISGLQGKILICNSCSLFHSLLYILNKHMVLVILNVLVITTWPGNQTKHNSRLGGKHWMVSERWCIHPARHQFNRHSPGICRHHQTYWPIHSLYPWALQKNGGDTNPPGAWYRKLPSGQPLPKLQLPKPSQREHGRDKTCGAVSFQCVYCHLLCCIRAAWLAWM